MFCNCVSFVIIICCISALYVSHQLHCSLNIAISQNPYWWTTTMLPAWHTVQKENHVLFHHGVFCVNVVIVALWVVFILHLSPLL